MATQFKRSGNVGHDGVGGGNPDRVGSGPTAARRHRAGRRGRAAAFVIGLTLAGITLAAVPAGAVGAAASPSSNCVVALSAGSGAAAPICFPTFTEAASFATNGAIANAPANAADAVNDPAFAAQVESSATRTKEATGSGSASATTASYIIGIEYDLPNYLSSSAGSMVFTGTHRCTGSLSDVDYQTVLPSTWRSWISSFRTFNVCWADHFYWGRFSGSHTGYLPSQPRMPIIGGVNFDNHTGAIRWS